MYPYLCNILCSIIFLPRWPLGGTHVHIEKALALVVIMEVRFDVSSIYLYMIFHEERMAI